MTSLYYITFHPSHLIPHLTLTPHTWSQVDSRYLSLFTVFNMTFPSDEALMHIFAQILQGHCQPFNKDIQGTIPKLVQMTMDLYK